jgi:hypothetical protein
MHYKLLKDKPYHRQDTLVSCGAACAQMTLDSLKGGTLYRQNYLAQAILENNTSDLAAPWGAAPDALRRVLERHQPAALETNMFQLIESNTECSVSRRIVWSIFKYDMPSIALVLQMRHWVVVYGYQITGVPKGPDDTNYEINGFFIHDPGPLYPTDPIEHEEGDVCGTVEGTGIMSMHVTYKTWQRIYMRGVPCDARSQWAGKHLAISYLDQPYEVEESLCTWEEPVGLQSSADSGSGQQPPVDSKALNEAVTRGASNGLVRYGLDKVSPWKGRLDDTGPKLEPGTPILFRYGPESDHPTLDAQDPIRHPYYLVPMEAHQGEPRVRRPMLVIVDINGEYSESFAMPNSQANTLSVASWQDLRKRAKTDNARQLDPLRKIIDNIDEKEEPDCQWMASCECLSRFVPVYVIPRGKGHYHIRADGFVLQRMHGRDGHDVWGL